MDDQGELIGWDDFYPFGLILPGRSINTANVHAIYKFTGHERDTEVGLVLDYMLARGYDPIISRFMQVDPLAEYPSPYIYVGNNPVNRIDPTGMSSECPSMGSGVSDGEQGIMVRACYDPTTNDTWVLVEEGDTQQDLYDFMSERGWEDKLSMTWRQDFAPGTMYRIGEGNLTYQTGYPGQGFPWWLDPTPRGKWKGLYLTWKRLLGGGLNSSKKQISKGLKARSVEEAAKTGIKSINQLNKLIKTGKLLKTITRFDKGKIFGELDHVHFSNGAALNIDGTWKHGSKVLTNKEIKILTENGWTLPK